MVYRYIVMICSILSQINFSVEFDMRWELSFFFQYCLLKCQYIYSYRPCPCHIDISCVYVSMQIDSKTFNTTMKLYGWSDRTIDFVPSIFNMIAIDNADSWIHICMYIFNLIYSESAPVKTIPRILCIWTQFVFFFSVSLIEFWLFFWF